MKIALFFMKIFKTKHLLYGNMKYIDDEKKEKNKRGGNVEMLDRQTDRQTDIIMVLH